MSVTLTVSEKDGRLSIGEIDNGEIEVKAEELGNIAHVYINKEQSELIIRNLIAQNGFDLYEQAVMAYVDEFCKGIDPSEHDYNYFENWAGDEVGGMCFIADYPFDFMEIKYCVDNKIESQKLFDYIDFCVENAHIGSWPNFQSWLKGCPIPKGEKRNYNRNERIIERIVRKRIKEMENK